MNTFNHQMPDSEGETSTSSTISTGGGLNSTTTTSGSASREHPIPEDSILALCGKLLTPRVRLDFGGIKPLTMYNFVATPAGLRKSTTFTPAEKIARQILMSDDLISGNASDSALFDTFEAQPHRLQFEDEGNTILRSWETNSYGREVSSRYLRLYDGAAWDQNFLREVKNHEDGKASRHIPQATLSLCIGSTFGVARLDQLEAGSGLRRRFGFYLASRQERTIIWPCTLEGAEMDHLANLFDHLSHLQGTVGRGSLTPAAMEYWTGLQQRNRERCLSIPGYTNSGEDLLSSLNESPAAASSWRPSSRPAGGPGAARSIPSPSPRRCWNWRRPIKMPAWTPWWSWRE